MQGSHAAIHFPQFFTYAGDDCAPKWARYLRDPDRPQDLCRRLREALGVTEDEIAAAKQRRDIGEWSYVQVAEVLEEKLSRTESRDNLASITKICRLHAEASGNAPCALGDTNPALQ